MDDGGKKRFYQFYNVVQDKITKQILVALFLIVVVIVLVIVTTEYKTLFLGMGGILILSLAYNIGNVWWLASCERIIAVPLTVSAITLAGYRAQNNKVTLVDKDNNEYTLVIKRQKDTLTGKARKKTRKYQIGDEFTVYMDKQLLNNDNGATMITNYIAIKSGTSENTVLPD